MPKNYTLSAKQRAERSQLLKSEQRSFDNAILSAPNSKQAARIRPSSFSSNYRSAASAGADHG